jgi:hypothetical protein
MKKQLLLFIFILNIGFAKAQHYTQGIPVDTVLYTGTYSFPGNSCQSGTYAKIELNPSLYNYVNGLEFMILVDTVTMGPPPQFSPVHAGDTFLLNAANPSYYTPASVVFNFRLKLVGTPTTSGQNFSCNLDYQLCACSCYQLIIMPSVTNTTVCTVDLSNQVKEIGNHTSLLIYPNPTANKLLVSGINQKNTIKLYNSFGALIIEQNAHQDMAIDTSLLPNGIYTLVTSSDAGSNGITQKVIIAR